MLGLELYQILYKVLSVHNGTQLHTREGGTNIEELDLLFDVIKTCYIYMNQSHFICNNMCNVDLALLCSLHVSLSLTHTPAWAHSLQMSHSSYMIHVGLSPC